MFRNNHPATSLLFAKVTTFIQKNVPISKFMQEISNDYLSRSHQSQDGEDNLSHSRKVDTLKVVIEKGQGDYAIFRDENCLMYLLYLIKNNQLEDEQSLTLLTYLMGVQSNYNIEIIHINDEANKVFKEKYIDAVVKKAQIIKIKIDKNKFAEEISKLSGVNAWMMIIKSPDASGNFLDLRNEIGFLKQVTEGMTVCLNAKEILSVHRFRDRELRYGIPSIAIMNKFVLQFNPYPIKYYPIFGIIAFETLIKLHTLGYHPVQLHGGIFVKNNLEMAHNSHLKPFAIMIHDLYHGYSGCLLNNDEHVYLYNYLIPELTLQIEKLSKDVSDSNDKFILVLKKVLDRLVDMDIGLFAYRVFIKGNYGRELFPAWLRYIYTKANNYSYLSEYDLSTIIKFYYNLFTSTSLSASAAVYDEFSRIPKASIMAKAVKDTLSAAKENLSTRVNINPIEIFCQKVNTHLFGESLLVDSFYRQYYNKLLGEFTSLLQRSQTAEEFLINLQSSKSLYVELIECGFIYIPGFSTFNDDDFQEIQKLASIIACNNPVSCILTTSWR